MPNGTVQAIGKSRSGKPTVTVDGQVYSASHVNLQGLRIGDRIEMDTASSMYNGSQIWFLKGWKLITAAPKGPLPQKPSQWIDAPSAPVSPQGGLSEAERIFAYGVVTAAITAKLVIDPQGVEKWVCAAKNALRSQGE